MATLAWRRSPGKTISMFYLCTAQLRGNIAVSLGLFRPICCTRDADCGPSHLVRIPCVCKFYGVKYYLSFMTSRSTAVSRTLGTSASIIDLTGLAGGGRIRGVGVVVGGGGGGAGASRYGRPRSHFPRILFRFHSASLPFSQPVLFVFVFLIFLVCFHAELGN